MPALRAVDVTPPRTFSAETRARATALLVALLWFEVLHDAARRAHPLPVPPALAAAVGLLAQVAFTAFEAAAAAWAWRLAGRRPGWAALLTRLFVVSSAEAVALGVASGRPALPAVVATWLAGGRAAAGVPAHGAAAVFASFGVLTLARLVLSAQAQAAVARAPFRRGAAVVLALYLATRLAMWWSLDLFQGRSFQTWGVTP